MCVGEFFAFSTQPATPILKASCEIIVLANQHSQPQWANATNKGEEVGEAE